MRILELFAGTRSIGKAFEARGHEVFSVEWDKDFKDIDLYADIGQLSAREVIERFGLPDVVWASPDCATFSVAAISYHRRLNKYTGSLEPITEYAQFCDKVDRNVLAIIRELQQERRRQGLPPLLYFIENPRGGMRKMDWMQGLPRYTVTYCKYELDKPLDQRRMKPTDIWTNHPNPKFKPACKNGDKCHVSAPRGARTGTQALKGSKERSVIPVLLCEHVVGICESYFST